MTVRDTIPDLPTPDLPAGDLRGGSPERLGAREALRRLGQRLAPGRAVELCGANGSLGPAVAARLAAARPPGAAPTVYLVADEDAAEARVGDLGFFLPHPPESDDPLAPPAVLHLPAPDASPYAEMQPDRRSILRRMAVLF